MEVIMVNIIVGIIYIGITFMVFGLIAGLVAAIAEMLSDVGIIDTIIRISCIPLSIAVFYFIGKSVLTN